MLHFRYRIQISDILWSWYLIIKLLGLLPSCLRWSVSAYVYRTLSHKKCVVFVDSLNVTYEYILCIYEYESREICPQGYKLVRKDRENQKGGGVAFLLRNGYNPKVLPTNHFTYFEHLAISMSTAPNLRFVVAYRPPVLSIALFIDDFAYLLEDTTLGGRDTDSFCRRFQPSLGSTK